MLMRKIILLQKRVAILFSLFKNFNSNYKQRQIVL